jgi:hypothetical protein
VKRHLTSSAALRRDDDPLKEDVKDDARRMKDKAKNKLHKAKLAAEETAVDVKEGAQEVWHKTKKAARAVKETVKETAAQAMAPMYGKDPKKEELYPVSDSEGARTGYKLSRASPEAAAEASGASLHEDVNSLRKTILDGPQDMPQGPGKRAKDVSGEPMETGTGGS